jgi:hypothetical protein
MAHILDNDISAYEGMKDQLIANHNGKFVIIYQGKLAGVYDTFDSAAKAAVSTLEQPYLIRQVGVSQSMPMPASVAYRPVHATT